MTPGSWKLDNATLELISTPEGYFQWLNENLGIGSISSGSYIAGTFTAGEDIGGGKVVMLNSSKVYNFDPSNTGNYAKSIGITNASVTNGNPVDVVLHGECNQLGGLIAGSSYFADINGGLTTSAPLTGISQIIGVAKNSITIVVELQKPYIKI